jgi:uncharacterized protein
MRNLEQRGHQVVVVIRPKDVLEQLCVDSAIKFIKIEERPKRMGMLGLAWSLLKKDIQVYKLVKKFKPCQLIGSDGTLARVGWLLRIPSFEYNEDDAEAIKLYAWLSFPFYSHIVTPEVTSSWLWEKKKITYNSYHELAYLHPHHFVPNKSVVSRYLNPDEKYFIIRFAKLTAHHDTGISGINTAIAERIISILKPHGKIFITSERGLEPQFEKYRIQISPLDMHHVMAFADIYIGDSQTMAAEAGVLGVPFVRFNDFVGRLSYLNELENKYILGFGHITSDAEGMYKSIQKLLDMENRKEVFQTRRSKMLADKINYADFQTWFIENYPESVTVLKDNPDFQYNFR